MLLRTGKVTNRQVGDKYHVRNILHRSMLLNLILQVLNSYITYAMKVVAWPFLLINLFSDTNGSQLVVKHVLDENKVNAASHVRKYQLGHEIFFKQEKIGAKTNLQVLIQDAKDVPVFFFWGGGRGNANYFDG